MAITPEKSVSRLLCEIAEGDIDPDDKVVLITWVPNPKYLKPKQGKNYSLHLNTVLKEFGRCMKKYCLCPEFTQAGNIHYHGWYVLNDPFKWYNIVLPKLKSRGLIKNPIMKSRKALEKYYKKDVELMEQSMYPLPVPHCHLTGNDRKKIEEKRYIKKYEEKIKNMSVDNWCDTTEGGILKYFALDELKRQNALADEVDVDDLLYK